MLLRNAYSRYLRIYLGFRKSSRRSGIDQHLHIDSRRKLRLFLILYKNGFAARHIRRFIILGFLSVLYRSSVVFRRNHRCLLLFRRIHILAFLRRNCEADRFSFIFSSDIFGNDGIVFRNLRQNSGSYRLSL